MTPLAERIIRSLSPEQKEQRLGEALTALDSIADPKGHFLHRDNEQCTGECAAIRKALREGSGKPQRLTPGCNQKWDHMQETPHGVVESNAQWNAGRQDAAQPAVGHQRDICARQKVPDYVATGPAGAYLKGAQGGYAVGVLSSPSVLPEVDWQRAMHEPVPPLPPSVTLEGLASVIGSLTGAYNTLCRSDDHSGVAHDAAEAIRALAKRSREVAGCRDETAPFPDGEVSAGSPSMVMTPEQMRAAMVEHMRQHQDHIAKEEMAKHDAAYNRAITDAAEAIQRLPFSADEGGTLSRAESTVRKLQRGVS